MNHNKLEIVDLYHNPEWDLAARKSILATWEQWGISVQIRLKALRRTDEIQITISINHRVLLVYYTIKSSTHGDCYYNSDHDSLEGHYLRSFLFSANCLRYNFIFDTDGMRITSDDENNKCDVSVLYDRLIDYNIRLYSLQYNRYELYHVDYNANANEDLVDGCLKHHFRLASDVEDTNNTEEIICAPTPPLDQTPPIPRKIAKRCRLNTTRYSPRKPVKVDYLRLSGGFRKH